MAFDPAVFAEMVALTIKAALTPVLERVAATEARVARLAAVELTLGELRDKCVTLETKAAMVVPVDIPEATDLAPVLHQIDGLRSRLDVVHEMARAVEAKASQPREAVPSGPSAAELELLTRDAVEPIKAALATLQERIAVLEVRPLQPGPAGKDGAPGLDGKDGAPGQHGLAGLSYEGVWQEGKAYEPGQLSTHGGSTWHCNEPTTSKPGENAKDWTLMVKRGRDGRDGKDAEIPPVVALGRR